MCMMDDAEGPIVSTTKSVTARKPHKCGECGRDIQKGEPYQHFSGLFGGLGFETYKTCQHCEVAQRWLAKECSGWLFSMVREDLEEHTGYGIGVCRLIIGMRRSWKRFDGGGLMKVAAMPQTKTVNAH